MNAKIKHEFSICSKIIRNIKYLTSYTICINNIQYTGGNLLHTYTLETTSGFFTYYTDRSNNGF